MCQRNKITRWKTFGTGIQPIKLVLKYGAAPAVFPNGEDDLTNGGFLAEFDWKYFGYQY